MVTFRSGLLLLLLGSLLLFVEGSTDTNSSHDEEHETIEVAKFEIKKFSVYITVLIFVICVILVKVGYHHVHILAAYIPESCILILIGIIFGAILRHAFKVNSEEWKLTSDLFFLLLLPPIILESSYALYNRTFADNLGTILLFAVLGTVLNFLFIGFSMYGMNEIGAMDNPQVNVTMKGFLLYSSLIVAVDPVAVLAIFQELGVEQSLYYTVFGESLLNDAVTIVLYDIMAEFIKFKHVSAQLIGLGIASFLTVSLGGFIVGVIMGIFCCFITRITYSSRIMEPLIILSMGYFAYIMGDLFGWSGLISMIGCGIVQAAYAFHNISAKSVIVVKRTIKMIAQLTEAIIFLFLGMELMSIKLKWNTGFHLWALFWCLLSRAVVVLIMCPLINAMRPTVRPIGYTEQIILIWGGLRGAVAYSLSTLIKSEDLGMGEDGRNLFMTATMFIILFTVVVMGTTMKPLAKILKIRLAPQTNLSLFGELNFSIVDHTMAGIEEISGEKGNNYLREFFINFDNKYLRHILQRDPLTHDQRLMATYEKVSVALHYAMIKPSESEHYLQKLNQGPRIRKRTTASASSVSLASMVSPIPPTVSQNHDEEARQIATRRGRRMTIANTSDDFQVKTAFRDLFYHNTAGEKSAEFKDTFHDVMKNREDFMKQRLMHFCKNEHGLHVYRAESCEHVHGLDTHNGGSQNRLKVPEEVVGTGSQARLKKSESIAERSNEDLFGNLGEVQLDTVLQFNGENDPVRFSLDGGGNDNEVTTKL